MLHPPRFAIQEVNRLFPDANARFLANPSAYARDTDLQSTFAIIRANKTSLENSADRKAQGIVESYRACTSQKGC
jgi:hypothetical protein